MLVTVCSEDNTSKAAMPKRSKASNDTEVEPKRRSTRLSSKPTTPAKPEPKTKTPVKAAAKPKKVKEVVEKVKPEEKKEAPEEKAALAENGETKDEEEAAEVADADEPEKEEDEAE
ncbi:high mobility group nucleosome-binding domain-containing protein 3 isoform X1 [Salmo trutta]|uniref:high mobility group nucleosome-binding domain-containing protein 3 isoform X1 n=2 Tax=Salmo trutta TaxID=8032 RepID=UPI0011327371|nr:high mobility group nucleosome-binding domain-containing protein 3-like isoform X1 [Salmo trutta]